MATKQQMAEIIEQYRAESTKAFIESKRDAEYIQQLFNDIAELKFKLAVSERENLALTLADLKID